jgi:hypothetical protein
MSWFNFLVVGLVLWISQGATAKPTAAVINGDLSGILAAKEIIAGKPLDKEEEEISNSWDAAVHPNNSKAGVLGVVSLWAKGDLGIVELVWWRQKDPEVRKCILLLYYSLTKVEADNFPQFEAYAARFDKAEAAARRAEIEEVKKLADASRAKLQKAFAAK